MQLLKKVFFLPLYWLTKLIPRSNKTWIFGSWFGKSYIDNSRYLFEYVSENHPEIQAVWITKNKQVYDKLKKRKYKVEYSNSLKGYWIIARAGYTFITQIIMEDIHPFAAADSTIVQLWHGTPLKKIYFDDIEGIKHNKIYGLKTKLFPYTSLNVDYVVCPNEFLAPRFMSAFKVRKSQLIFSDSPRADVILKSNANDKKRGKSTKIIAYIPTFRKNGDLFLDDVTVVENILSKYNAVLVIKLHPKDQANCPSINSDRIIVNNESIKDVNTFLNSVDVLITDYSSVYFDYLILNRPIIFAPFDLSTYLQEERNMYDSYEDVTPGPKCSDWKEVANYLELILSGEDHFKKERESLSDKFLYRETNNRNNERIIQSLLTKLRNGE